MDDSSSVLAVAFSRYDTPSIRYPNQFLYSSVLSKVMMGAGQIKATRPVKGSTMQEKSSSWNSGNIGITLSKYVNTS